MSLDELLKKNQDVNITVSIGLKDLEEWRARIVAETLQKIEMQKKDEKERLSPAQVCKELGITRGTLTNWDRAKLIPKHKVGRVVWYTRKDINDFIKKSKVKNDE